jgi:serine/threonine-protein kinase
MDKEEAAIREGQQGVELFPVSADAWNGPIMVDNLAHIYLFLGHHDAAIDQLELLLSIPTVFTTGRLRIEPRYDPLRDHPRFQALLEKYEQPQQ